MAIAKTSVVAASLIALFINKAIAANISESDAVNLLDKRIVDSQSYKWVKPSCLGFASEATGQQYFEFAIYEKHSKRCGGDPNIRHIIDRFRVSRNQEKIEWYDSANDRYVSFEQFLSRRK